MRKRWVGFAALVIAVGLITVVALERSGVEVMSLVATGPNRVTCEGYPEKRVYLENQSWVSPQPGDPAHPGTGQQGHIHVGACVPLLQDVTSATLELDIKVQLHNVPGQPLRMRVYMYQMGPPEVRFVPPPIPTCDTADCETWVHASLPLSQIAVSGWGELTMAVWVDMEDGRHTWYNWPRWFINVQNGKPVRTNQPSFDVAPLIRIGGDTWLSWPEGGRTNYSQVSIATEDFPWNFETGELIPISGVWQPEVTYLGTNVAKQVYGEGLALIDPRLHAVPTDLGTVVYDGPGGVRQLSIDTTMLTNGQHRLLLASCDPRPDGVENCGVLVVPFLVGN